MPLHLYLEAASLEELRAAAILALDLKLGLNRAEANAHAATLQAEVLKEETKDTATTEIPEKVEEQVTESTAAPVEKAKRTRKPKAEPGLIATFAKEIEAQADVETTKEPPKKLTLESVRSAFDQYVQKFGVQAAQIDGPILLGRVYGSSIARIKDVPEDDIGKLGRIVAAVEGAILTNEFKRDTVQ